MLIEITNYPLLRAVSLCRYTGDDKDRQKEVRGISFEPSTGLAIATDGKRLFAAPCISQSDAPDVIWKPAHNFAKSAHKPARLDTDTGTLCTIRAHGPFPFVAGAMLSGVYPNWRKVLPEKCTGYGSMHIGINAELIADVQKALESSGVGLQWENEVKPIYVTFGKSPILPLTDADDYIFVLMPYSIWRSLGGAQ
jgi:hypothetical protein